MFLLFLLHELSADLCKFPHSRLFFLRLNPLFSLFSLCVVVVAVVVVGIMASTDAPVMDSISDAVAASSHHAVLCLLLLFFTFCFVFVLCLFIFLHSILSVFPFSIGPFSFCFGFTLRRSCTSYSKVDASESGTVWPIERVVVSLGLVLFDSSQLLARMAAATGSLINNSNDGRVVRAHSQCSAFYKKNREKNHQTFVFFLLLFVYVCVVSL
jgi:archaellum component FlaG (FlaF/FlaG flagellin family)